VSDAGRQPKPTGSDAKEGVLIRLLAPTGKSRLRLLVLALLLVVWIAFLIGLYLSMRRSHTPAVPASTATAMAFPR
jgi:hypothetical protein